jgi:HD-GYP domain-containing protein (c-di-GMP phosphodiesterase class II)
MYNILATSQDPLAQMHREIKEESPWLENHLLRTEQLTYDLALACGFPEEEALIFGEAGEHHDVTKIAVHPIVRNKPGPQTKKEKKAMGTHTLIAPILFESLARKAAPEERPKIAILQDAARYHHAYWNGTNHPKWMSGEMIPLSARMVAVAEAFDSVTSTDRPYRKGLTKDEAIEHIRKLSGIKFDPNLAEVFLNLL